MGLLSLGIPLLPSSRPSRAPEKTTRPIRIWGWGLPYMCDVSPPVVLHQSVNISTVNLLYQVGQDRGQPLPFWGYTWTRTHEGMTLMPTGFTGMARVTGQTTGLPPILTFFGVYLIFNMWNTCPRTMMSSEAL